MGTRETEGDSGAPQLADLLASGRPQTDLAEDVPVPVALHDLRQHVVWANAAYREATGLSLRELQGRRCYRVWGLEGPCRGCPVSTVMATGERAEAELTPQNQDRWPEDQGSWLAKAAPLRDEEGALIGVIETAIDITTRVRAEGRLQRSEGTFRQLIDHLPSGVAIYEPLDGGTDFVFKDLNATAERLEGVSRAAVVGKRVTEVFPGVKAFGLFDVLRRVCVSGDPEHFPVAQYRDERIAGWRDNHVFKLPGGEIVAAYYDVSQIKLAEAGLRQAWAFLDTVVDQSPFAMWISDPDGVVTRTNRALRQTLNLTDEQIVGNYCVLEDENLAAQGVLPLVRAVFERLEPARFSIAWRAQQAGDEAFSGARDLQIDVSMFPITSEEGALRHVVCQWVDVTDRKRAEDDLRELSRTLERRVDERTQELEAANRELEAANEELEGFAYSVSHDLRTPLRAINSFAQILSERCGGALDERGRHYCDNIVKASQRMDRLIEDLLRHSRLGRDAVSLEPIAVARVLDGALEILAERIGDAGADVRVAEGLPRVVANETLLEQVLVNLIDNALKYRRPDQPAAVRVSWELQGERVVLAVADSGIGIDPRHHEQVFRVFQRLHGADDYAGTGIGLAVVAKAVALMNGRVWVESERDRGSTFFVELGRARP